MERAEIVRTVEQAVLGVHEIGEKVAAAPVGSPEAVINDTA